MSLSDEVVEVSAEEMNTLSNALIVAAQRYDDDAKVCEAAGQLHLAEQFRRQSEDVQQLWDALN